MWKINFVQKETVLKFEEKKKSRELEGDLSIQNNHATSSRDASLFKRNLSVLLTAPFKQSLISTK